MGTEAVIFHSPTNNLRLVRVQATRRMNDRGEFDTTPGEAHVFQNGTFTVTSDLEDRYPGLTDWLRKHRQNGVLFHEPAKIEPSRHGSDSSEVIARIFELAASGDVSAIGDILVEERSDQSRAEVIVACEKAIEQADGSLPPPPPEPTHQVERTRPDVVASAGGPEHPVTQAQQAAAASQATDGSGPASLEDLNVDQLQELAKSRDVRGRTSMRKAELITAIRGQQG